MDVVVQSDNVEEEKDLAVNDGSTGSNGSITGKSNMKGLDELRNSLSIYDLPDREKLKKAVERINNDFDGLQSDYGYLVDPERSGCCCACCYRIRDILMTLLSILFLLIPIILYWILIAIILSLIFLLTFRWCKYSYSEFFQKSIHNIRLWILTFKNKQSMIYGFFDRTIEFVQVFMVLKGLLTNTFFAYHDQMQKLYLGEAYPYSFKLILKKYDDIWKLIHKKDLADTDYNNKEYWDRENHVFGAAMSDKDLSRYYLPQCLSIRDYRHRIGRDIVMMCIFIDNLDEYTNLPCYEHTKFAKYMSIPKDESDDSEKKWLFKKYYKYPKCKSSEKIIYHGSMFYRMFGIEFTDEELSKIDGWVAAIAFVSFPRWLNQILLNRIMLRRAFIAIDTIAKIIDKRCNNIVKQRLLNYATKLGINRMSVLYSAAIQWAFIGGSAAFGNALVRFENDPKSEYEAFKNNPENYVLELIRYRSQVLGSTTHIAAKEYKVRINGKIWTFPPGTPVSSSLTGVSDSMPTPYAHKFNAYRPRSAYDEMVAFHCKDGYFNPHSKVCLRDRKKYGDKAGINARYCPGRVVGPPHLVEILTFQFEELKQHFAFDDDDDDSTNNLLDLDQVDKQLSNFNKLVSKSLNDGVKEHNAEKQFDYLPEPISEEKMELEKFSKSSLFGRKLIEKDLYYERSASKDRTFSLITKIDLVFPVRDYATLFDETSLNNSRKLMSMFRDERLTMPKVNVVWPSLTSNNDMSKFAFGGLVCGYTVKINNDGQSCGSSGSITGLGKHLADCPPNAVYANDMTFLYDFEVRKGLYRYGACAYFDDKYELIAIYVSHMKTTVHVNEMDITYAKYAWTTSAVTALTLKEHALVSHFTESNALVDNTYEKLPLNHWLRRLCHIFTYRTVYINQSMEKVLLVENGLVHRIWGFTYKSLGKMCRWVFDNYKYVEFTKRYDNNLNDIPDSIFPYKKDSKDFYNLIRNFVYSYCKGYKHTFDNDEYLSSFYNGLCNDLGINAEEEKENAFNLDNLVSILSNLFCVVTAWHEQVGGVFDVVCRDLNWHDTKLYQKKDDFTQFSSNDYVSTAILVMITGVKNPGILNDFKMVLLKDENFEKNTKIFDDWQNDLQNLSKKIDERNKSRRIPWMCCQPRNLECSLSI
eukprot:225440_1